MQPHLGDVRGNRAVLGNASPAETSSAFVWRGDLPRSGNSPTGPFTLLPTIPASMLQPALAAAFPPGDFRAAADQAGARGGLLVGSGRGIRVHLVIVQRSQDALYAQLTSRPWQEAVTVIWDRRLYDRRRVAHQGGRRHGDRRRSPPVAWGALGVLVVSCEDAPS
jgi:hypothetical protein